MLISGLSARDVLYLTGQPLSLLDDPLAVLLAYVTFYDQRGDGIETAFKGDKGVGMTRRNKKLFAAQQMVMLLGALAHNVFIWGRRLLLASQPRLHQYGMVRDVFHISGFLVRDTVGQIRQIEHNLEAPLAPALVVSLRELLTPAHIAIILGET